jgi:hypothetical protein
MTLETLKRCEVCGELYKPNGYHQKYCVGCKPTRTKSRDKKCDMCGKPFKDYGRQNNTKYCSDRCRRLAHNEQAANWVCYMRMEKLWEQMK